MLLDIKGKNLSSYGFRFLEGSKNPIAQTWAVGWEERESPYFWDGMRRKEMGKYVFQYTLSGLGSLEIDGELHTIGPGQSFFVEIPSNHRYYVPETGSPWEFIFIMFYGTEAAAVHKYLKNEWGQINSYHPQSPLIQLLMNIYRKAREKKITDGFQSSSLAYEFIMELYRCVQYRDKSEKILSEAITKGISFVLAHYDQPINLEDISSASGLSMYHFARVFHKEIGLTPIQYLTKIRMEKGIEFLRSTNDTVEDIAKRLGYANGNYFCKVFKQLIGVSPTDFRTGKDAVPVDHLTID